MNIRKSFEKAKAMRGYKSSYEVALGMSMTPAALHNRVSSKNVQTKTIERLASFFDMKASEFIALGED